MYSERTQVLLTPEQRERVERLAARRGISVGAVIRAAIDAHAPPRQHAPEEALERLLALEAPVGDWTDMKAEIVKGALS